MRTTLNWLTFLPSTAPVSTSCQLSVTDAARFLLPTYWSTRGKLTECVHATVACLRTSKLLVTFAKYLKPTNTQLSLQFTELRLLRRLELGLKHTILPLLLRHAILPLL